MNRFADTKGLLRGRVIVKGILYYARIPRVVDGEGLMLRVHCIVSGLPVMVYGGGFFVKDSLHRVADTKHGLMGEGVYLRVYSIVSRTPRLV